MDGANDSAGEVLVGYLVTHPDGYEARLGPDRTRAELYAARNLAMLEPMFVRRPAARQAGAGGPNGAAPMPGATAPIARPGPLFARSLDQPV